MRENFSLRNAISSGYVLERMLRSYLYRSDRVIHPSRENLISKYLQQFVEQFSFVYYVASERVSVDFLVETHSDGNNYIFKSLRLIHISRDVTITKSIRRNLILANAK